MRIIHLLASFDQNANAAVTVVHTGVAQTVQVEVRRHRGRTERIRALLINNLNLVPDEKCLLHVILDPSFLLSKEHRVPKLPGL